MKALLALEDGYTLTGRSFTGPGETSGEVVFNTSMTGYQEVLTDPSYRGQMVTMTYPLIGNYGINPEDVESDRIQVSAFLIREYQEFYSNYRATSSLADYLSGSAVLGIDQLDTRALTRHIRTAGAMRAFLSTEDLDPQSLVNRAQQIPSMVGQDLARVVTVPRPYFWIDGKPVFPQDDIPLNKNIWKQRGLKPSVIAFDYGIKYNILRCLENSGFEIFVLPASFNADTIKSLKPNGIFLSNGPGDPEPVNYAVETIQSLLDYRPIFVICLGIQLLGLALGGTTY